VLKILYAGSPSASALVLELLLQDKKISAAGCAIVGVLTNPPAARGRHHVPVPTPVEVAASNAKIPVFTPVHLDSALREQIVPLRADILVCFAYGHIFGPKFLSLFPAGAVNLHPSLLPKYRGCTPVPAAIFNRDKETGVSVQKIVQELDAGDIILQQKIILAGTETTGSLLNRCAHEGAVLLSDILCRTSVTGLLPPAVPQSGEVSYTGMMTKEEGHIDWTRTALEIDARIRACTPEPGCWTTNVDRVLRILTAHAEPEMQSDVAPGTVTAYDRKKGILICTGAGLLAVTELQWQTKTVMNCMDFMNGCHNFVGTVLQ